MFYLNQSCRCITKEEGRIKLKKEDKGYNRKN
jgi:hypothetical protein